MSRIRNLTQRLADRIRRMDPRPRWVAAKLRMRARASAGRARCAELVNLAKLQLRRAAKWAAPHLAKAGVATTFTVLGLLRLVRLPRRRTTYWRNKTAASGPYEAW